MTFFAGTVERVIFENPSNLFRILVLTVEDTDYEDYPDDEVIVTGTMVEIFEGEQYTFWGDMVNHPRYGEQLRVDKYERAKPTSSGLVSYFSGEQFKGIGKKTAQKIIELYGDDPIDKILENPEKLKEISGLTAVRREEFIKKLKLNYGTERLLAKLAEYDISGRHAVAIIDAYKDEALDIINENPYQLVEDIKGIGFKIADKLAERLGIDSTSPQRYRAALIYCIFEKSMEEGNTYIEAKDLLDAAVQLLEESRLVEIPLADVAQEITHLIEEDKLQNHGTKIFENSLYFSEQGIKTQLSRLLSNELSPINPTNIDRLISKTERQHNITYDEIQKKAIHDAITNKVFILTGGPGTGKTTVINGIISVYAELYDIDLHKKHTPILLAAPTGRASRRMNELTGLQSATIHRHLGIIGNDEEFDEADSEVDDYLDADLIIVDEFSMVDTWLANQLFRHIHSDTQVIIVGDSDQLPSVGPGQVLADLLKVESIPKVSLERIFRQSDESTIVTLASQIRQGIVAPDFTTRKADRSYFEAPSEAIPKMVGQIVQSAINKGIPEQDIQILAPMYRGTAGITALNQLMQEQLNPLGDDIQFQYTEINFRKNDKVLHLVNDAEANVFNGDIGYITDLIPAKYTESKQDEIFLDFDGNEIIYPRSEWYKITLAYAMSIHKSQGSEFQVVILPITRSTRRMLQRNLIYTAITRSKSKLILLGEFEAFKYAIENTGTQRQTFLVERFQGLEDSEIPSSEEVVEHVTETVESSSNPIQEEELAQPNEDTIFSEPETLDDKKDYILTPDNYLLIDPMIGLSTKDIEQFFGDKKA